jgi:drug/metabolite transporter (DMT)-like permease
MGWVAVGNSTAGALLIISSTKQQNGGSHPTFLGDLLVFISMIAAVAFVLLCKRLLKIYPPIIVTCYSFLVGTAILAGWVIPLYGVPPIHLSALTLMALFAQGIFATAVATIFLNWGLSKVPASEAGIFVNFEPLLGSILGVSILGESLGTAGFVGGAMILGAAFYLSRSQRSS